MLADVLQRVGRSRQLVRIPGSLFAPTMVPRRCLLKEEQQCYCVPLCDCPWFQEHEETFSRCGAESVTGKGRVRKWIGLNRQFHRPFLCSPSSSRLAASLATAKLVIGLAGTGYFFLQTNSLLAG
jgi:hypothetical protein